MKNRLLPRQKIPKEYTWDLDPLYKSDKAWFRALKQLERHIERFHEFRGKLASSPEILRSCCDLRMKFEKLAERIGSYAFLKSSEDLGNSVYQGMVGQYTHIATRAEEVLSFFAPEICNIPQKRIEELLDSSILSDYKFFLQKIRRFKSHILSEREERLLAMHGEVASALERIFGQLNDVDMKFGDIVDKRGKKISLTHASFRSLMESPDRTVRKKAFFQFYKQYKDHANTLAATLYASVLQDVFLARARNFSSSLDAALFPDNVPRSVYDNLICTVRRHLPVVYRYLDLRRRILKLRKLHFYDMYVPLISRRKIKIPYEQAVDLVCNAVTPLGEEYRKILRDGLLGRWVDRYENIGKRSGAFSAGCYTGPPYILLNYREDTIDNVFTLAHESGHSMHTWFSVRNQPFQYYQYEIFVAEVASSFNEQLLANYMLKTTQDPLIQAYVINRELDEIRGTIVRQTMFAEFEKIIHELVEAGEPLTRETLCGEYRKLLDIYFGSDFKVDDVLPLECLRIPHFYHAFYVYKYATGLSAAIAFATRILNGDTDVLQRYLNLLKAGGSKFPLDLLRDAGVDMEKPEPIDAAMQHFNKRIDELEFLLKSLKSVS